MKKLKRQPLYMQLAELLKEEIAKNYVPSDQLPSESALAKHFEVSVMTLREAMSALAQEGLIERVHGKGNFVADIRHEKHIAILNELNLSAPKVSGFFMKVINCVAEHFEEHGYSHRFYLGNTTPGASPPPRPTCREFWDAFEQKSISAVLAITSWLNPEWTALFEKEQIPIVGNASRSVNSVSFDHKDMICQGGQYLVREGCQKIMIFSYSDSSDRTTYEQNRERVLGVSQDWGALIRDICVCGFSDRSNSIQQLFLDAWRDTENRPDGILVTDEVLFDELVNMMFSLEVKVPEELKVVTHQNLGITNFEFMPIASLVVNPEEFAKTLAQLTIELVENPEKEVPQITTKARLVEQPALKKYKKQRMATVSQAIE